MEKLERIKELCDKATPGPWDNRCLNSLDNMAKPRHTCSEYGFIGEFNSPMDSSVADAEFTAMARNVLPTLVEVIEKQYALIKKLDSFNTGCELMHNSTELFQELDSCLIETDKLLGEL